MPNVTILTSEFERQRLLVEFYEGQTFRSYDDAYYLFVKDTVYNENLDCFVSALEEWWQRNNGKHAQYQSALIDFMKKDLSVFIAINQLQVMLVPEWKSRPEICTSMKGNVLNSLIHNMMRDF